jgi:hypothetical protein
MNQTTTVITHTIRRNPFTNQTLISSLSISINFIQERISHL